MPSQSWYDYLTSPASIPLISERHAELRKSRGIYKVGLTYACITSTI